jgi:hypothetical protein
MLKLQEIRIITVELQLMLHMLSFNNHFIKNLSNIGKNFLNKNFILEIFYDIIHACECFSDGNKSSVLVSIKIEDTY